MQLSSTTCDQTIQSQNKQELPYFKLLSTVMAQIEKTRQMNAQKDNLIQEEIVKTQEGILPQDEVKSQSISSDSSAFKPFKKDDYEDLFADDQQEINMIPLKIVNNNSGENQFYKFYKTLKLNSKFPHLISINTIVLAKNLEHTIWPAKIVNVRQLETDTKNNKIIYMVEFINKKKSLELFKYCLLQFTQHNVKKLKEFNHDKKLHKALKIAEKMHQNNKNLTVKYEHFTPILKSKQEQIEEKILLVKNIILHGQQKYEQKSLLKTQESNATVSQQTVKKEQSISIITMNHKKKWMPLNLTIETPKIKLQDVKHLNSDQTDSEEQLIKNIFKKTLKKEFNDDETFFHQEDQSQKVKILGQKLKNTHQTKSKQKRLKSYLKQLSAKLQNLENKPMLEKILRYLQQYNRQIKRYQKNRKKRYHLDKVLIFFKRSIEEYDKKDISKYRKIIEMSIELCSHHLSILNDFDLAFIEVLKKQLCSVYQLLRNYKGQNVFINVVKEILIPNLKKIVDNMEQNIKIEA